MSENVAGKSMSGAVDQNLLPLLAKLYRDLDSDVAAAAPRCEISTRCCRFADYGHTLFLSDLEAEYLFSAGIPHGSSGQHRCPYQINGLCTARERRPLGCRVFFCDPAYRQRQTELSEDYIGRLKRLYGRMGRPWNYRPLHWFLERAADGSSVV